MIDGRYNSQKKKMLAWTENFQQPNVKPKLIYLVEGQPKKFDAKCGHGCMSRCGWPKYTDVEAIFSWWLLIFLKLTNFLKQ